MHTDPKDVHGQDLVQIIEHLNMAENREVMLSTTKLPPQDLAAMYGMVDCTINISDAEGFGLATLESLSTGTPIIVNMTGGLQEQVTNGKEWFGWGIQPSSKAVIGSLQVPYIYEDRISQQDFEDCLNKALKLTKKRYSAMAEAGRNHVLENYNFENYEKQWVKIMDEFIEKHGSWENRKNFNPWVLLEVA